MSFYQQLLPLRARRQVSALYPLVPPSLLSNCHPVISSHGGAAQTLMGGSSISARPPSASASSATAPLGLLKWLKFNVREEGLGLEGGGWGGEGNAMHF